MNKINSKTIVKAFALLVFTLGSTPGIADSIEALTKKCSSCHGEKGISNNDAWPNLAGQKPTYLAVQIRDFQDGHRVDPLMSVAVKGLSNKDIDRLSAYYASVVPKAVVVDQPVNQAGKNIRARCISCHGMQGKTVNDQWPNISGQKKEYLRKQLIAFRDGSRHSDVMKVIVKDLTDKQIADVADYYSQLKP